MRRLLIILLLVAPLSATTHYLDCAVSSSGNGLAWATAWKNFSNITGLVAGDTVNLSGGATSQTCNTGEYIGVNGTSGSPIIYQVSTDVGHNGTLTINGTSGSQFLFGSSTQNQWSTWQGNAGNHLVIQGWQTPINVQNIQGVKFHYVNISNIASGGSSAPILRMDGSINIEFDHCLFDLASGNDHAIFAGGDNSAGNYTEVLIHDNTFNLRYKRGAGLGDDGIEAISNATINNNQFVGIFDAAYPGNQHQDGIQSGRTYVVVSNNSFLNMQNYPIYGDAVGGQTIAHWRIFNNVMNQIDTTGSQGISIGCDGTTCTQNDMLVYNNTVANSAHCIFVNNGTAGTVTSSSVENNVCWQAGEIIANGVTTVDYNICGITPCPGTHSLPSTNANLNASNFKLQSGSPAIGAALNLTSSCSGELATLCTDMDGVARGSSWDMGAQQFFVSIVSLSPTSMPFGNQAVSSTSATQSTTLTNTGTATLNITSIALQAGTQFSITSNTCGSSLSPTSSCVISVTFTPLSVGIKNDQIVFTTDASTSPDIVNLSGTGITTSPYSIMVKPGASLTMGVSIK